MDGFDALESLLSADLTKNLRGFKDAFDAFKGFRPNVSGVAGGATYIPARNAFLAPRKFDELRQSPDYAIEELKVKFKAMPFKDSYDYTGLNTKLKTIIESSAFSEHDARLFLKDYVLVSRNDVRNRPLLHDKKAPKFSDVLYNYRATPYGLNIVDGIAGFDYLGRPEFESKVVVSTRSESKIDVVLTAASPSSAARMERHLLTNNPPLVLSAAKTTLNGLKQAIASQVEVESGPCVAFVRFEVDGGEVDAPHYVYNFVGTLSKRRDPPETVPTDAIASSFSQGVKLPPKLVYAEQFLESWKNTQRDQRFLHYSNDGTPVVMPSVDGYDDLFLMGIQLAIDKSGRADGSLESAVGFDPDSKEPWHAVARVSVHKWKDYEQSVEQAKTKLNGMAAGNDDSAWYFRFKDLFAGGGAKRLLMPGEAAAADRADFAALALNRLKWRVPASLYAELSELSGLPAGWTTRDAAIDAFGGELRAFRQRLEDDYVKLPRVFDSANYITLLVELDESGEPLFGSDAILGRLLILLVLREIAFLADTKTRVAAADGALREAGELALDMGVAGAPVGPIPHNVDTAPFEAFKEKLCKYLDIASTLSYNELDVQIKEWRYQKTTTDKKITNFVKDVGVKMIDAVVEEFLPVTLISMCSAAILDENDEYLLESDDTTRFEGGYGNNDGDDGDEAVPARGDAAPTPDDPEFLNWTMEAYMSTYKALSMVTTAQGLVERLRDGFSSKRVVKLFDTKLNGRKSIEEYVKYVWNSETEKPPSGSWVPDFVKFLFGDGHQNDEKKKAFVILLRFHIAQTSNWDGAVKGMLDGAEKGIKWYKNPNNNNTKAALKRLMGFQDRPDYKLSILNQPEEWRRQKGINLIQLEMTLIRSFMAGSVKDKNTVVNHMRNLDHISDALGHIRLIATNKDTPAVLQQFYTDALSAIVPLGNRDAFFDFEGYASYRWQKTAPGAQIFPLEPLLNSAGVESPSTLPPVSALPPAPAASPKIRTASRNRLLATHNLVDRMAKDAVKNTVNNLATNESEPSTLLHRAVARRRLLNTSRAELNGHREFSWSSPDIEHLFYVLDIDNPWSKQRRELSGARSYDVPLFRQDVEMHRFAEAMIPTSPVDVTDNDMPKDVTRNTPVKNDLYRWMWLAQFEAHDATRFAGNRMSLEGAIKRTGDRPSRRFVVQSNEGLHSSGSVLLKASADSSVEHVYFKNFSEITNMTFDPNLLLTAAGANTFSDRLFLTGGFLTEAELEDVYRKVIKDHNNTKWDDRLPDATSNESFTNEDLMFVRMSKRHKERFDWLRKAALAVYDAHRRELGGETLEPTDAAFLEAMKGKIENEEAVKKYGFGNLYYVNYNDVKSLPINMRFLHFYDLSESLKEGQRFCPYKFDDFALHAIDVGQRINAIQLAFRQRRQEDERFRSVQNLIDRCKTMQDELNSMTVSCATFKLLLLGSASADFDRAQTSKHNGDELQWASHLSTTPKNVKFNDELTFIADDEQRKKLLELISFADGLIKDYRELAKKLSKLKIEAVFLQQVGNLLYKKAGTKNSQRTLKSDYTVGYSYYHPWRVASTEFPTSEMAIDVNEIKRITGVYITKPSGQSNTGFLHGSMYTVGGLEADNSHSAVRDALTARGHLYEDGRLPLRDKRVGVFTSYHPVNVNVDYGVLALYAKHIVEIEGGADGDDESKITGPAFQYYVAELHTMLKEWRSVERLPTFAELAAETVPNSCFDSIESFFMPSRAALKKTLAKASTLKRLKTASFDLELFEPAAAFDTESVAVEDLGGETTGKQIAFFLNVLKKMPTRQWARFLTLSASNEEIPEVEKTVNWKALKPQNATVVVEEDVDVEIVGVEDIDMSDVDMDYVDDVELVDGCGEEDDYDDNDGGVCVKDSADDGPTPAKRPRLALPQRKCISSVASPNFTVLKTQIFGNCFYESVAKAIGKGTKEGYRKCTAKFFCTPPDQMSLYRRGQWFDVAKQLAMGVMTYKNADTEEQRKTTLVFEAVKNSPGLVKLAEAVEDIGSIAHPGWHALMATYGRVVGQDEWWANFLEVRALGFATNTQLCIYAPQKVDGKTIRIDLNFDLGDVEGAEYKFFPDQFVPILWNLDARGQGKHFEGLKIRQPTPMNTERPAARLTWTPTNEKTAAASEKAGLLEAVARANRLYAHPGVLDCAAKLQAALRRWALADATKLNIQPRHERATWTACHRKLLKALDAGAVDDRHIAAVAHVASVNIAVYAEQPGTQWALLTDAARPFSCAFEVSLLRQSNGRYVVR